MCFHWVVLKIFSFSPEYQCRGFPGPGIEDPMSENPFFDLVGASSYSYADQKKRATTEFNSFTNKHGKTYKDDVELSKRKAVFNHNLRYMYMYVLCANVQCLQLFPLTHVNSKAKGEIIILEIFNVEKFSYN